MGITLTVDEYQELVDDSGGYCMACGETVYGVEPDAHGYDCDGCGAPCVYGAEELLLLGDVLLTD